MARRAGIVGGVLHTNVVRSGDGSGPVGVGDGMQLDVTPAKEEEAEDFTHAVVVGHVNNVGKVLHTGIVGLGDGNSSSFIEVGDDQVQVDVMPDCRKRRKRWPEILTWQVEAEITPVLEFLSVLF